MKKYTNWAVLQFDDSLTGNAQESAQVKVYLAGTTTEAAIFSDVSGTTPIVQPILTNTTAQENPGRFEFYSAGGLFDIVINEGAADETKIEDVSISTEVSVKDFGAVGDGFADDTAAIQTALDYAETIEGSVFAPNGTYNHTGLTIGRGVRLFGETREGTIFFTIASSDTDAITVTNVRCTIERLTLDGNRDNNTTGNAINANLASSPSAIFTKIKDLDITKFPNVGVIFKNANMSEIESTSITRVETGVTVERTVPLLMRNVDIAKFTIEGLLIKGTATNVQVDYSGGFMETSTDAPVASAPFIHIESMRENDSISLENIWMNGHAVDLGYTTVGIHIDTPLMANNISTNNVVMYDLAASVSYTAISTTNTGFNDLTGINYTAATPEPARSLGFFTKNSYYVDFLSDDLDLTTGGTRRLYPIEGEPIEIQKVVELTTSARTGAGVMNFGYNGTGGAFGTFTLPNGTSNNTVTDVTSQLSNLKRTGASFDVLTMSASTPSTVGTAKYRVKAVVY